MQFDSNQGLAARTAYFRSRGCEGVNTHEKAQRTQLRCCHRAVMLGSAYASLVDCEHTIVVGRYRGRANWPATDADERRWRQSSRPSACLLRCGSSGGRRRLRLLQLLWSPTVRVCSLSGLLLIFQLKSAARWAALFCLFLPCRLRWQSRLDNYRDRSQNTLAPDDCR
jgi:hypothetical protein